MEKKREREIETEEREIKGEREKDRESERTGVRVRETRDEWEGERRVFTVIVAWDCIKPNQKSG